MVLVIAEKPSVAQALAKVLGADRKENGYLSGNGYTVSWCVGHLAEYAQPEFYDEKYGKWKFSDLPIVPDKWEFSLEKDKSGRFKLLKELLNSEGLEYVVNACDAGREGELIFDRVYELSGSNTPVRRLWISSLEDAAIRDGFNHLRPGKEYESLREAAVCRAKADWLVGINATRAFSTKYHKRLSVGRVQTPTLAMIVERKREIDNFKKAYYYKVTLESNGFSFASGAIGAETDAKALAERCEGQPAVITGVERKQKRTAPPKLYDLTTIQREANRFWGYTAQETLEELQTLYEQKLVTYPRTDSRYITTDMGITAGELVKVLPGKFKFLTDGKEGGDVGRIMNDGEVTDHHAILPTKEAVLQDLDKLSGKQRNILGMVAQRLMEAVSEDFIYEETTVEAVCGGETFSAKGRRAVQLGFRENESVFRKMLRIGRKTGEEEQEEMADVFGTVREGMTIAPVHVVKSIHSTVPPKAYTEDTLLQSMERAGADDFSQIEGLERKGIGTPATRAGVIEKLVKSGFVERDGKNLVPTASGMELIRVLPDSVKSVKLTAEWEAGLKRMERGEIPPEEFMDAIIGMVRKLVKDCADRKTGDGEAAKVEREALGNCPRCGKPVYEGKKSFYCSGYKGTPHCTFTLWKESPYFRSKHKELTRDVVAALLKDGKVEMKGLYSEKKGRTYDAVVVMEDAGGKYVNFKLEFPDGGK